MLHNNTMMWSVVRENVHVMVSDHAHSMMPRTSLLVYKPSCSKLNEHTT